MPRYFFNVYHENAEPDETGEQLTDLDAAWNEATVTAGQILKDLNGKFRPGVDWRLEVTDECANLLFVINVNAKLSNSEVRRGLSADLIDSRPDPLQS